MSEPPNSPPDLQFEKADYGSAEAAQPACTACHQPIYGSYYDVNGRMVCEQCKTALELGQSQGSPAGRFIKATLYGALAAGLGSAIWYGVRAATDMNFGLIAIVVGVLVGGAVKKGSEGRGGWLYQALAVFLTYTSIVSTYIPMIVQYAMDQPAGKPKASASTPAAPATAPAETEPPTAQASAEDKPAFGLVGFLIGIAVLFALAFALPFLAGFKNVLGLFIIGIGLYEAWKINKRVALAISGPYRVGATPPAAGG